MSAPLDDSPLRPTALSNGRLRPVPAAAQCPASSRRAPKQACCHHVPSCSAQQAWLYECSRLIQQVHHSEKRLSHLQQ